MTGSRYVLHLCDDRGGRVVRYASARELAAGDVVEIAQHGVWRVTGVVSAGDRGVRDGVAYCEAAAESASTLGNSHEES